MMNYIRFNHWSLKKIRLKYHNKTLVLFSNLKHEQILILNPKLNNTKTTESLSSTEVTGISIPTSSALMRGMTLPLQVPTKTTRCSSDVQKEPNTSENVSSEKNSFGVASHQTSAQNTARLPFYHFNRAPSNIPKYYPFTDYIYQTLITKV